MYLEEIFGLKGKTALVTGGGRGIGQVIALALAKAGANVAILNRGNTEDTVKMIRDAGGNALGVKADVTREKEVDAALAKVLKQFGSIDIVFIDTPNKP